MIYELLGYAPDANPTVLGVLTQASGVIPTFKGFKGAPSPSNTPLATLAATCQGAAVLYKLDLSTRFFAGTPTKLYEAGASTWSDVSRSATYNTVSTARWRFAQQGNVSFAANGADTVQASVSTGAFSCIAGAPVAAIVEVVGGFVFAANTSAGSNIIQWAGINGYTSWSASVSTQAGSDTMSASPGGITAARRFGTALVVYKKNSMFLGTYAGPPTIWEFNSRQIPGNVGALSQEAVANIGTPDNPKHIFMGEDDFYLFDGSKPVPIGTNRVKRTVFGSLLQSRYYACAALHDKTNNVVYFYYPVSDSPQPDHCVVYNYRTDKWGVDDRQIEAVVDYVSPGITYDGLGGYYATYDDLPSAPYDIVFANNAQTQPGIFDTTHKIKTLTGAAGSTSFTTGDFGDPKVVSCVTRLRPIFLTAPNSATWTHHYRMNPGDALTSDSAASLDGQGKIDLLREARWHRGTMQLTGDWEMASLSIEAEEAGLE